jgi:hypothetical protein
MTRLIQKITECDALRMVLDHLGETPQHVDKLTADGAPDFVVTRADGAQVGVEVTEPANEEFARGRATFERLADRLRERLTLPLRLHLESTPGFVSRLRQDDIDGIVGALLVLAEAHFTSRGTRAEYRGDALRGYGVHLLRRVAVAPAPGPMVMWVAPRVAFSADPSTREQVDKKTSKLAAYRRHAPTAREWWLVLLGGERLDSAESAEHMRKTELRTAFDRVFFVDRRMQVVVAVRTQP